MLVAALSACVAEPESLNSERIERKFGSFGIAVLSDEGGVRRTNLFSLENGRRTCRTYAIVRFDNVPEELIGEQHTQILSGLSIGATFKQSGWDILKQTRYLGDFNLSGSHSPIPGLMKLQSDPTVAMHVYRLALKKGEQIVEYATIIELHHPDYLNHESLSELYRVDESDRLDTNELSILSTLVLNGPH